MVESKIEKDYFEKIRAYLRRTRIWDVEIDKENTPDDEHHFAFMLTNKYEEKSFTIIHADSEHEASDISEPRPRWHYYYLMFWQENVCMSGNLGSVVEFKWYGDEDDVLARIKQLVNRRYY